MVVKFVILCVVVAGVNCQYDYQHVIDQTQQLQQIEKFGRNSTPDNYNNIYPRLDNTTNGFSYDDRWFNGSTGGLYNSSHVYLHPFNVTERFLNKTLSGMSKGICMKEVPTVLLLKKNEVAVAGNGSNPTLSRIQVCCEGYQRNIHNFKICDPICKSECVNGYCIAPDTCVCYPDHVLNLGGFCLPTCPIGCGNGYCNSDNTCSCKPGFALERNGKFCIPKCSNGCQNGNCSAPEECSCNKGFTFSSTGKCEYVCSRGCENGDCMAPDVCECHRGYSKVDNVCQPLCSRGCLNGNCIAPEVCQCDGYGWSLDSTGTRCVASCDKPCLNGVCSGPNQCSCRSGYGLDSVNPFRCVPQCDLPCVNGVCSGPNLCLCYPGYVKDRSVKGSSRCVQA